jgi:hypothetical protein
MNARSLVDKSALARMPLAPVRQRLGPIIEAGQAATCSVIDLDAIRAYVGQLASALTQDPIQDGG